MTSNNSDFYKPEPDTKADAADGLSFLSASVTQSQSSIATIKGNYPEDEGSVLRAFKISTGLHDAELLEEQVQNFITL